jgi:hypothetical protein
MPYLHFLDCCLFGFHAGVRMSSRVHERIHNELTIEPFRCPAATCRYVGNGKVQWSVHYGSVHGLLKKYEQQHADQTSNNKENGGMAFNGGTSNGTSIGTSNVERALIARAPRFMCVQCNLIADTKDAISQHIKESHGKTTITLKSEVKKEIKVDPQPYNLEKFVKETFRALKPIPVEQLRNEMGVANKALQLNNRSLQITSDGIKSEIKTEYDLPPSVIVRYGNDDYQNPQRSDLTISGPMKVSRIGSDVRINNENRLQETVVQLNDPKIEIERNLKTTIARLNGIIAESRVKTNLNQTRDIMKLKEKDDKIAQLQAQLAIKENESRHEITTGKTITVNDPLKNKDDLIADLQAQLSIKAIELENSSDMIKQSMITVGQLTMERNRLKVDLEIEKQSNTELKSRSDVNSSELIKCKRLVVNLIQK